KAARGAVSECPVLYDLTLKAYHDQTKRNQAWRDISAMLGVTAEVSRKKWKYLRDKYLKERKAERDRKKSGAGATSFKRWKYIAIMGFLECHVKERVTSSNMEQGDYSQDSQEIPATDTSPPSPPTTSTVALVTPLHPVPPPPRRRQSLVPSLRRLSHQKKAQARMRMQQVLYDVEFGE
uniref:MADF domain-containing protein n=1 Tax=Gadus morhua TaxID=8049 RepID=A0A8C5C994_GADMO